MDMVILMRVCWRPTFPLKCVWLSWTHSASSSWALRSSLYYVADWKGVVLSQKVQFWFMSKFVLRVDQNVVGNKLGFKFPKTKNGHGCEPERLEHQIRDRDEEMIHEITGLTRCTWIKKRHSFLHLCLCRRSCVLIWDTILWWRKCSRCTCASCRSLSQRWLWSTSSPHCVPSYTRCTIKHLTCQS